jgi:hypothetical protein
MGERCEAHLMHSWIGLPEAVSARGRLWPGEGAAIIEIGAPLLTVRLLM